MHRSVELAQYNAAAFAEVCLRHGIRRSMGRVGSSCDIALAESFFQGLKRELLHGRRWTSKAQTRLELFRRGAPLIAHGQARDLLGESHLRTGYVLAIQTAYGQVDAQRTTAKSNIGDTPYVAAVAPRTGPAASRTSRRTIGSRAGTDRHDYIGDIGRYNQHIGQLRQQTCKFNWALPQATRYADRSTVSPR